MSEQSVDLGAIRGDWDYHCRYVTNAMEQTLKRLQKTWRALKAGAPAAGQVAMDGPLVEEFLEACRQTRALTDDMSLMRETMPAKKGRRIAKRPAVKKRQARRQGRAAR
jgi:hypothetical protein